MGRCVVVGGSYIGNYEFVREHLRDDDFVIYCDCGLSHMDGLGAEPSLIVGDFDSHENPGLNIETIVLPTVKDDTDTVYAVKEAVKRGFTDFVLVGALGKRFDHSLGNLSILLMLDSMGLSGVIVDDYSEIRVVSGEVGKSSEEGSPDTYGGFSEEEPGVLSVSDACKYFSVLAAGGDAHGVTIRNAKYNIENADIKSDFPLGVSNEVPAGSIAEVSVKQGRLFVIEVFSE
ncbi:thiamine diphosphokinase [Butyrivibrio sp. VCD2006]|uniref:thiamine diphosphokinase n=1 Tax=Butyrivibrio sp. VCD2006 TaxID=1280664 RepID=UPI0004043AD3|nr:thiamine diphosphokinase [Butyrivibrio sp. VCD2006]